MAGGVSKTHGLNLLSVQNILSAHNLVHEGGTAHTRGVVELLMCKLPIGPTIGTLINHQNTLCVPGENRNTETEIIRIYPFSAR